MSSYQRAPEAGRGLRLHLNENTGGCSPAVLEAIRSLGADDIAFYPPYDDVERDVAGHLGLDRARIALVNGLDEGLHAVSALALRPDPEGLRSAIVPEPAFEMYAACTRAAGGIVRRIAPRDDFQFPQREIAQALDSRARLLFITNPDNPTGRAVPASTIAAMAAAAPHVTVLVDEAYIDFGGETVLRFIDTQRNLIVGRTFAKAYGLAALRAGCLIAHPQTLAPIRELLSPYNLNVAAAVALQAAIRDRAWRDRYVAESHRSRQLIYGFCDERRIQYYRSAANFVLVRLGSETPAIVRALAGRGIFVRDRSTQPGCAGCIRITAGLSEHTAACLTALGELL